MRTTHVRSADAVSGKADVVNRRDLLLNAARDVFFEDGYQKATMRQVARRAGMTQAAIYYHFTDKEDLLFTMIDNFTDRFAAMLMGAMASAQSPEEKLSKLISVQLDMLIEDTKDLKILSHDKGHLSEMRLRVIRSKEKTVLTIYRACLEEMRKEGCLTDIDSTVAAFTIIGAINWLYQWYRPDGDLPWQTVKKSILKQVVRGVCTPDRAERPLAVRAHPNDQAASRRNRQ